MKLRNPTHRLVQLRTKQGTIIIQPGSYAELNFHQRRELEKHIKHFGLEWELEEKDLPAGIDPSKYKGTHAYALAHQDDTTFDANAVKQQNDAEEIASVWSEVETRGWSELPEPEEDAQNEELIFIKEAVEDEAALKGSEGGEGETVPRGTGEEAEASQASQSQIQTSEAEPYEEVPDEGPEYLRAGDPEGISITDEVSTVSGKKTEYQKIEYMEAPKNCPYTKSQLMLGVKAQLFEICDKLSLDMNGTKSDLINRIFDYYAKK